MQTTSDPTPPDFGVVLSAWLLTPGEYAYLVSVHRITVSRWLKASHLAYAADGLAGEANRAIAAIYRDKLTELAMIDRHFLGRLDPLKRRSPWQDRAHFFALLARLAP